MAVVVVPEFCSMKPQQVFVREATGLVRGLGARDALLMNTIGIAALVSAVPLLSTASTVYPGANLYVAFTLAFLVSIPFSLVFAMMAIAFPRTGGDYVFNSRIVHPAYGLASSGLYLSLNIIGIGFFSPFVGFYLSNMFSVAGTIYNIPSLVSLGTFISTGNGTMVLGTILVVWSSLTVIFGLGLYKRTQNALFVLAIIGTVVLFGVMAFSNHQSFVNSFNAAAAPYNTSYSDIMNRATAAGYSPASFSMPTTILATVFFISYLSTPWPQLVAGEIKRPVRSQMISMLGSCVISFLVYLIAIGLYYSAFGVDFTNAITWLATNSPSNYPLPTSPYLTYFASVMAGNPIVLVLVGLGLISWTLALMPNFYLIVSRPLFAYAFDRVFPEKFASINERTHTPVFNILFTAVFSELFLVAAAYASWWYGQMFNGGVFLMIYFLFTMFAAILFPFAKKDLFESSPPIVKGRIGPIPVISLLGAITAGGMIWALSTYLIHPELSGPVNAVSLGTWAAITIFFAGSYFVARWYRKTRQEIDIDFNYRQVPPE